MIEFYWSIWAAWLWWRYQVHITKMPVLSKKNSRYVLNECVSNGIKKSTELKLLGVRDCDIKEWKNNRKTVYNNINIELEKNIEKRIARKTK